jgi:hypothetical protein
VIFFPKNPTPGIFFLPRCIVIISFSTSDAIFEIFCNTAPVSKACVKLPIFTGFSVNRISTAFSKGAFAAGRI